MNFFVYVFHWLLRFILPTRCMSCDIALLDDAGLCQKCWNKVHFISGVICQKCGYPMEFDLAEDNKNVICGRCISQKEQYSFERARSVCSYGTVISRVVGRLKYSDNLHIAKFIAKSMLSCFLQNFSTCDIICPVPMHKKSLHKRTFNQSALIAILLVKMLKKQNINIQYIPDLLQKIKITKRQNQLSRQQRLENVKGSFSINHKYNINNKKIVILDDVITTGATINECSKVIKKNSKSAKIYVISYSRTTLASVDYENEESI